MRIYITGPGGSGKSTLARKLGEKYHIPVIHLDELFWKEEWVENEDYKALQIQAIAREEWIIEGPSCSILGLLQTRADFIILLNLSPLGNIFRILKRFFQGAKKRVGFALGNNQIHLDFLRKTLHYRSRQLPRIRENIAKYSLENKLIEIRSSKNMLETVLSRLEEGK